MGESKIMKSWFIKLKCELTPNMRGSKEGSSLDRFFSCFKGSEQEGLGESTSVTTQFFPQG